MMNIAIIHGSPKGNFSTTKQYTDYLKKHITQHTYNEVFVGKEIKKIDSDHIFYNTIIETIKNCDAIVWTFPVYYYMVPSQLKKFIELIYERESMSAFEGKYSTCISTSANFFDHTAHNYIHAVCDDLGMKYIDGFPAEMSDLLNDEKRINLIGFFQHFILVSGACLPVAKTFAPLRNLSIDYTTSSLVESIVRTNQKIVLLTDALPNDQNLNYMIQTFTACFENAVDVVNLCSIDIKGGCLGCGQCLRSGKCFYKDSYETLFYEKINSADALIFAGAMKDRYLSSTWKVFFDRNFFNGHRPVLNHKYLGFIISGPLMQNSNLRQILEATCQVWKTPLLGIITDEADSSCNLTDEIKAFAKIICNRLETGWQMSDSFLGVGGHKVFRDLVYLKKYLLKADHEYYKENGNYDFPQKNIKERINGFMISIMLGVLSRKKKSMKGMGQQLMPFKKIIEKK